MQILILGAGGHAKVLIDSFANESILGILDINPDLIGKKVLGIPVLGCEDEVLKNYAPEKILLVNAVGSVGNNKIRQSIYEKWSQKGYKFANVIHPTAYLGKEVVLGEGVEMMAGAIIQPGSKLGNNIIINTKASIDHDCHIEDHVHIAPGVTCCADVVIGKGTHIGCGAVVRQGVKIGPYSLIAAGAVVVKDIIGGTKVAGVPAKEMELT